MVDKVVITGSGIVSSLGLSAAETWDSLVSGKTGIKQLSDFRQKGYVSHLAAQVNSLRPSDLKIHLRDARIMDRHSFMLLKCSRESFHQAKVSECIAPEDIGFFAGMGMVDYSIDDLMPAVIKSQNKAGEIDYNKFFSEGFQEIYPLWPLSTMNNISFCQVAIDLNIKGENSVFAPHADSGTHAIIEAYHAVLEKKAKAVLAGGVSDKVSPLSMARAAFFDLLNTSEQANNCGCRPFSKNRNGIVLGEGCGIMTLELKSSADNRNIPSLAVLTGYGTSFEVSNDSHCPTAQAISLSMEEALANSGLNPCEIDVIIAHGEGTLMGDSHEVVAIHKTFADCIKKIYVFSSKSALGHLSAGAPAVDALLGISILKNGIIPPVKNALPIQDDIMFKISDEPVMANPKRILINSQSHEGQCASLILEAAN